MMPRRLLLLASLFAAVTAHEAKVLSKSHDQQKGHAAIEEELRHDRLQKPEHAIPLGEEEGDDVESFTCTLTGASGKDVCDGTKDDDGTGCVWCILNSFGFCCSEEQAQTFKQAIPTIDCDDSSDDDKAPPAPDDDKAPGPLWECLESKDETACGAEYDDEDTEDVDEAASRDATNEEGDDEDYDDEEEQDEEAEQDGDYEDGDEEEDDMHEFVVDTSCVLSAMLLDPDDDEATSEAACFQARDISGNPCEWCAVAGSPFRLCLSESQAQVAEYVGAVCTGSDESFEPEEFDDSCIAHMHEDSGLTHQGCWKHMDLDGNGCEWCNIMGVELCLGGVQAELVEHWGATCVMDDSEHKMAQEAIQQHQEYIHAQKEAKRIERAAKGIPEEEVQEEEEDLDIDSLWLTSDTSCMVTTLRTSSSDDSELACAQTQDAKGNPCNWCEMGTSFNMCLNEEQAEVAEYMGIECETISTDAQQILKEHAARSQEYADEDEDEEETDEENDAETAEEEEEEDDVGDFDTSCILSMQNGPSKDACTATKDADGTACEWCSWNSFQICLTDEQAEFVKPFGGTCDEEVNEELSETDIAEAKAVKEEFWNCIQHTGAGVEACASTKANACTWCNTQAGAGVCFSYEAVVAVNGNEFFDCIIDSEQHAAARNPQDGPKVDTSCLIDAGRFGDEEKCESGKDSVTGKPCEWCQLGSLGVNACLSAEQANLALPLGVTCKGKEAISAPEGDAAPLFQSLPNDFLPCLSQSSSVDVCDESCTWCDLKGSTSGAGLCLSDPVADAVGYLTGESILDCTEPEEEDSPDAEETTANVVLGGKEEAVDPSVA
ncbi:expressed unknown protein [Seminavis robusta]|uniref:Uncharacterized protein n=1 Tax=Seminavis robusta TaxID=568900 RepID=A0A9N8HLJ3_9STRA|nr:expressed unknown protein [Seminavis robusta]|eukprot:Sro825_g207650.1 n/a (832) ;mRNA; r:11570-14257